MSEQPDTSAVNAATNPHPNRGLYIEVTRPETHGGNRCVWHYDDFDWKDEMDGSEVGDSITLTLRKMTDEEFADLGDFEGW